MLLRAKRTLIIFIAVALLSLGLGAHAAQAADSVWRARYWNNTEMSGAPVLEREEGDRLDYNWGAETPAGPGVNLDNFSAEWTRTVNIDRAGTYRFDAQVDDGVRVYVDDVLVVDEWKLGAARTVSGERYLTAGDHELKVFYFDAGVVARIGLTWSFVSPWPTVFDGWRGEYFNNEDLVGPAVLVRDDEKIDFAWGLQSPSAAVSADHFSARWTRTVDLPGGTYVFRVYSDDGVRLWVDGDLVVDRWKDQSLTPTWATVELPGGDVDIRMEYYEAEMFASARLDWVEVDAENGSWMVEYWANPDLDGLPVAVGTADELPIDVDWGYGAPVQQIGADHFSVRWTRDIVFTPGRHRFTVRSDDGVRLWVNNRLIIDRWSAHAPTTYYADVYLTGGTVPVRLEYFEDEVTAEAELRWDFLSWSDESLSHATVRSESLNIRRGPSTAYRVIENISRGTEVELAGFVSEDGQWVLVTLPGHGVRGWAYAGLLNRNVSLDRLSVWGGNDATVMVGANSATVTAYSRLNVRQGPGLSHDVLTSVPRGMKLEMAGYRSVDNRWVLVTLPDSGLRGWVYAPLTTTSVSVSSLAAWAPGTSGTVTAYYLNLRSGPGVEHSILTFLARGEEVTLLERDEECCWVRVVSEGGQIGWVTASYLDASVALMDLPAAH